MKVLNYGMQICNHSTAKGRIALEPDISNVPGQTPQDLAKVCPLTICLLSTRHRTSVLFTFDKSEMFHTFLDCWLSSLDILASHRYTRYFTWSSVHRSCVAVVLPCFFSCFLFPSVEVDVLAISFVGLLVLLPGLLPD